jgi:preprotein translocase subunit SecA
MDEEERDEQETMGEMMLLVEREKHINDIKNLKRYYPQLYKVKEEFFEGVLNNKQSQKLLKRYEKKFNQMSFLNEPKSQNRIGNFDDDWYDEEDRDEPFIREEEKIGRNDSCSCGSGKKYKKCCGKNK